MTSGWWYSPLRLERVGLVTVDVGAVRSGAELAFSRERLEVYQGSPRQLIKQWVTTESVRLTVRGLESTRAHCAARYS